jgi:diguanylate cyclase (GGDEF)-like protein
MMSASGATESRLYDLSIFHDVAKALTSSLDLDIILETIMQKMAAYFEPATWALIMLDEASGEPHYAAPVEAEFQHLNQVRLKTGQSLAALLIETGEPLVIPDLRLDPRVDIATVSPLIPGDCSVVCLPVRTVNSIFGVMQLMGINLQVYKQNELFLRTISDYAAIAIENARAVRRIQELSITDDCTKLYNQRHLFTVLEDEVHRSARFGYEFTLLFLDLDYFKSVNDKYGHIIGSKLIGMVGQCLRENLRLIDAAFRYGGDEFAILLPQTSRESGLFVARRIARAFHRREWRPDGKITIPLRASIGVASYPQDATTPQEIVQRADELMYEVKQAGRDNIALAGTGIVGLGDLSAGD